MAKSNKFSVYYYNFEVNEQSQTNNPFFFFCGTKEYRKKLMERYKTFQKTEINGIERQNKLYASKMTGEKNNNYRSVLFFFTFYCFEFFSHLI